MNREEILTLDRDDLIELVERKYGFKLTRVKLSAKGLRGFIQ